MMFGKDSVTTRYQSRDYWENRNVSKFVKTTPVIPLLRVRVSHVPNHFTILRIMKQHLCDRHLHTPRDKRSRESL